MSETLEVGGEGGEALGHRVHAAHGGGFEAFDALLAPVGAAVEVAGEVAEAVEPGAGVARARGGGAHLDGVPAVGGAHPR